MYWSVATQHQSHVLVLRSLSLNGLPDEMEKRIADEPETIEKITSRLLDLGINPSFTIKTPEVGINLVETLENDYKLQKDTRRGLNEAVEFVSSQHDATTRRLIEEFLEDEEEHLNWLEAERDLLEKLSEANYHLARLS